MVPATHHKLQCLNDDVSRALVTKIDGYDSDSQTHTNLITVPDLLVPTIDDEFHPVGTSARGVHPCDKHLMRAARMFLPSDDGLNLRTMGEL